MGTQELSYGIECNIIGIELIGKKYSVEDSI